MQQALLTTMRPIDGLVVEGDSPFDAVKIRGPRVLTQIVQMKQSGIAADVDQIVCMVERVGPGERQEDGTLRPIEGIQPGDLVYCAKYAGSQLALGDQHRLLLMEDEIQAVIDKSRVRRH